MSPSAKKINELFGYFVITYYSITKLVWISCMIFKIINILNVTNHCLLWSDLILESDRCYCVFSTEAVHIIMLEMKMKILGWILFGAQLLQMCFQGQNVPAIGLS